MEEERNKEKERKDGAKYSLDNGKQTHTHTHYTHNTYIEVKNTQNIVWIMS